MKLTELIAAAPWREAVMFRKTRPHEYVLLQKDGERKLMQAVCQRIRDGEAFNGYFFCRPTIYLFIADYKYWFMVDCAEINLDGDEEEVLNRARLYHDRRDFYIQYGDTSMREDYPGPPWWQRQEASGDEVNIVSST